jgi:hypothetical protein
MSVSAVLYLVSFYWPFLLVAGLVGMAAGWFIHVPKR